MFSGIIDFIMGIWNLLMVIPVVISICSVIVALTPTPADDKLWDPKYISGSRSPCISNW